MLKFNSAGCWCPLKYPMSIHHFTFMMNLLQVFRKKLDFGVKIWNLCYQMMSVVVELNSIFCFLKFIQLEMFMNVKKIINCVLSFNKFNSEAKEWGKEKKICIKTIPKNFFNFYCHEQTKMKKKKKTKKVVEEMAYDVSRHNSYSLESCTSLLVFSCHRYVFEK